MDYNSPDSIGITLGRWAVAVSLAAEDHIYGQMGGLMGIGGKPGQVTGTFNIKPNEYMA